MRILHIVEASFAGVGRHVQDLAEWQQKSHEVTVIYGSNRCSSGFLARTLEMPAVNWVPVETSRFVSAKDWKSFQLCRKKIADFKPDVVHGHSSKGGVLARLCANPDQSRIIYTPNAIYTMNPELSTFMRFAVSTVETRLSKRTHCIIAVSPEERSHLLKLTIDPSRIAMVPNGIGEIGEFRKNQVRNDLGLPPDNLVMGFVGRLDRQKSPDALIDVYTKLSSEVKQPVTLAIVGEGPMGDEMREAVRENGFNQDQIRFLGYQDGPKSMAAFDMFVLPSRYEGFPYVLIEAAATGLPIVTTVEANASQIVLDGKNGFVRAFGDSEGLAMAISKLLCDVELRDLFSVNARDIAKSFTLDNMCRKTQDVYQKQGGLLN
ncbi:glycosyltransferase family 4 protein [Granulosicoccus sp. 3-233]|uniref:glycosyltransferase family 4 protein n=1 Tax=Granulosicoccus sp. 3-233 TaxID=3417969 RepID=UPI003D346161